MAILIDDLNRFWDRHDPIYLAAYVLWRLNWIHPFINGNGRTARVAAYYIICLSLGGWLPGEILLPDLLRRDRDEYVAALRAADDSLAHGAADLSALHGLMQRLLEEQLAPFIPAAADAP
jgi:Fic family protein